MKYLVLYEKSATAFGAYVPDLPGCVAVGATMEEAKKLIQEAISLHIDSLKAHGEPVPQPTTQSEFVTVQSA